MYQHEKRKTQKYKPDITKNTRQWKYQKAVHLHPMGFYNFIITIEYRFKVIKEFDLGNLETMADKDEDMDELRKPTKNVRKLHLKLQYYSNNNTY